LGEKIRTLQSADMQDYRKLRVEASNASKTLNKLLSIEKENTGLCSELSGVLERCTAQAAEF
jgi:hypothetical protein